ncbi:MAG: protein-L-isoaspartate O-methyltransferase [Burkholderiaceae bacterium]|nr:protein-L-isoaspartate O-methyltransferase [Burkholderiaceae bacterium]
MDDIDFARLRAAMVDTQVAGRGVSSPTVLDAMRGVPREVFVPEPLREFAYEDVALPLPQGQTVPQPCVVGLMTGALGLSADSKVLEIGAGAGYTMAVLSRIAASVFAIEPVDQLAVTAATTLAGLGCGNAHVIHAEAAAGWPSQAPFDAILVHQGGSHVPEMLKQQLAVGGRLVMPVGADPGVLELVRVTRLSDVAFRTEDIADVRFDPALGARPRIPPIANRGASGTACDGRLSDEVLAAAIAAAGERFATPNIANLEPLLARIGDARVVLMGEASHGTAEFHRMRERISRELIERKDFTFIAIEADWPDAARIDHYVREARHRATEWTAFARFPVWMWRNQEVRGFVDWLHQHNKTATRKVAFHGLDLYSLYNSIRSVLGYLDDMDPPTAKVARQRYGCLTPWQSDPATYGHAALTDQYRTCEREVVSMLTELLKKRPVYAEHDGERFLDAVQNARLVTNAERYYREMYYGSRAAWNLRDTHMFETLKNLLAFHGPQSKAIVWAHNSHIGDSAATEMSLRGEFNIGHLCRKEFGNAAYLIGFGTHSGTVAAATHWDAPMEVKAVRPSLAGSYERLCHESGVARFILPLRQPTPTALIDGLNVSRLERAIGVIYRPETERQSHYFEAVLPRQFDEYIWFDETRAVTPLQTEEIEGLPDTYPFGL